MSAGILTPDWAPFYAAVPRSLFLPETIWPFDMDKGSSVTVSRATDPETWQDYALADVPIVTQWDDGEHTGHDPGTVPTSSASMPSVVFSMLSALDVQAGHRVLEIGTGTGWSAALLAHRLGPGNITTLEVDPALSERARGALRRAGYAVGAVCADGALGYPRRAPYPRIIATCAVRAIPPAWIEQCAPGGVIVTPWGTHWGNGDAVVKLVTAANGRSATGHFVGPVEFMKLRDQRQPPVQHKDYVTPDAEREERTSSLTADEFLGDRFDPLQFALGLRVPQCVRVVATPEDGRQPVWLYSLADRSWACALFKGQQPTQVWESGPRRLWAEVESSCAWWNSHGKPAHDRFGLTVTPHEQTAWLDSPDNHWPV
ncbi:protein-L-isoaspartate(D-aspartate) O-methyltransferase [Streptomyces sp. NA04227]|uniref:methyltransferase domain-containing protein n=1 Tax=Streptomyces sp. NA04227 TaxID=2742136 RepID=UPI0015908818|nr:methyltransferase domain-containing protein [Streptomyces sp. NA04227]QKW06668.1 protein-L-isoaspartate(D-aspartate) O-methyltransferase [Streptomyces sp. NA04227]